MLARIMARTHMITAWTHHPADVYPQTLELSWIQSVADICPHKATSSPEGIPPRQD